MIGTTLRAAAACALAAFLLVSSPAASAAPAPGSRPNAAAAEAMAAALAASKDDRTAVASGIESFLDFIGEKRGEEAARALRSMRSPSELSAFLAARYGATAREEAFDAFAAWDARASGPAWDEDKAARLETDHFAIIAMPGSAAHRDREYLARFLERLVKDIEAVIAPSGTARALLERNLGSARAGKIEIVLTRGSMDSGRPGAASEASFGLTVSGSALAPTASIKTPYYNALSTAPLASEIAHLVDVYCKLDASGAPPLPSEGMVGSEAEKMRRDLSKWAQSSFERIIPYDTGFGEGFAEYAADRTCAIRRGLFGEAGAMRASAAGRDRPSEDILERRPPSSDRLATVILSAERGSFVSRLIARHGLERFLDFYLGASLDEKRFRKIFGEGFKQAQAEWRSSRGS